MDNPKVQKETVKKQLEKQLTKGDNWFIIDVKWFLKWKQYVQFDSDKKVNGPIEKYHPGKIDNSGLMTENQVRSGLISGGEVDVVPEETWDSLVKWYGVEQTDTSIFKRKIVELPDETLRVEVNPIRYKLSMLEKAKTEATEIDFSEWQTVGDLEKIMQRHFNLGEKTCLYTKNDRGEVMKVNLSSNIRLGDSGLESKKTIFIKEMNQEKPKENSSSFNLRSGATSSGHVPPGVCGLSNLGNTCFMNSSLQCLSNMPPLTRHFLSGAWKADLNRDNPIGMGGRIAMAYAELIKAMWSGQCSSTAPRELKYSVSQFAPQFSGYAQHDSHELMVFLLDGIHEDLNRITKKPYIEYKEPDPRLTDKELATLSWKQHRLRNNSIVVDYLHGMLRSRVQCPECETISRTFDPFSSLSLPLPNECEYSQTVTWVPLDTNQPICKLRLSLVRGGVVGDVAKAVEKLVVGSSAASMVVAEVYNHKVHTTYNTKDALTKFNDSDVIFVYELSDNMKEECTVDVTFKTPNRIYGHTVFGIPLLISVKRSGVSYREISHILWQRLQRHLPSTITGTTQDEPMDQSNGSDDAFVYPHLEKFCNVIVKKGYEEVNWKSTDEHGDIQLERCNISLEWNSESYKLYRDGIVNTIISEEKPRKMVRLDDCFRLFTTQEKLGHHDLWQCPKCKKQQQAFKKFDLWDLPDLLIVHLKRFYFKTWRRDKINTSVYFPLEGLDMSQWTLNKQQECIYDLVAVSNHMGGMGGGHYTAYAKNAENRQWYEFNDSYAQRIDPEEVAGARNAYLLVYTRRNVSRDP